MVNPHLRSLKFGVSSSNITRTQANASAFFALSKTSLKAFKHSQLFFYLPKEVWWQMSSPLRVLAWWQIFSSQQEGREKVSHPGVP